MISRLFISLMGLAYVAAQCPQTYQYSTTNGASPSVPINSGVSVTFPQGGMALNVQNMTINQSMNVTGIAVYPWGTPDSVGTFNLTGGIYTNQSGIATALYATQFVQEGSWSLYSQSSTLNPLILPFESSFMLDAGTYLIGFWVGNTTATQSIGDVKFATPDSVASSLVLHVNGTFSKVPTTIDTIADYTRLAPGHVSSLVTQPMTCSSSSSSSSSTGMYGSSSSSGFNGAVDQQVHAALLIVVSFVAATVYLS